MPHLRQGVIKGKEVAIKQPRDAISKSVALLTEDRRATGIMGVLSVADNISIASLDALRRAPSCWTTRRSWIWWPPTKRRWPSRRRPKTQIKSLSGGNQQKVLIARWLANNPDVLILDEPTRGIDVGAKYEIYCIIADLAKQGKSIIMISSEMSELIGMSDRIMVMCDGRCTGFIDGKEQPGEHHGRWLPSLRPPSERQIRKCLCGAKKFGFKKCLCNNAIIILILLSLFVGFIDPELLYRDKRQKPAAERRPRVSSSPAAFRAA